VIEINTSIDKELTVLEVAQDRYVEAQKWLKAVQVPYTHAIEILKEAMAQDDDVVAAKDRLEEFEDLYREAEREAQAAAVGAWEGDETGGRKEWQQQGWEVRLRTAKTPSVENVGEFVDHVSSIKAASIIRSISLHKKDVVDLHETVEGGIMGLNVEERTTASFRKAEEE
jgi:hypothetical protein